MDKVEKIFLMITDLYDKPFLDLERTFMEFTITDKQISKLNFLIGRELNGLFIDKELDLISLTEYNEKRKILQKAYNLVSRKRR